MILIALFAVLAIFSVTRAEGKWKLWNSLIILASCGVGFGAAYLMGVWGRNMALGGELAIPATFVCGALAAVLCPRKKKVAAKG